MKLKKNDSATFTFHPPGGFTTNRGTHTQTIAFIYIRVRLAGRVISRVGCIFAIKRNYFAAPF